MQQLSDNYITAYFRYCYIYCLLQKKWYIINRMMFVMWIIKGKRRNENNSQPSAISQQFSNVAAHFLVYLTYF